MKPRRSNVIAIVATLICLCVPGMGRAQAQGEVATLGAVNTFVASETAGVRVRVPRPATFEPGVDSPDIRIEGAGRMAGYVLVEDSTDVEGRVSVMTTWSRFCRRPGCASGDPFFWHSGSNVPYDPQTKVRTLPPGDYFLYVIADHTEVTVTLRLDGLTGKRKTRLIRPADAGIVLPRVRSTSLNNKTAYWFGEEVDFSGPTGIAIPLLRFETGRAVVNRREACYYSGGPGVPDPVAYGPGCPSADLGIAVQETGYADRHEVVDGYFSQVTGNAAWGFGMNYIVGGEVREADSLFFYVDVDPEEL